MLTWGSSRRCPVKGWDVIFIEQAQGLQGRAICFFGGLRLSLNVEVSGCFVSCASSSQTTTTTITKLNLYIYIYCLYIQTHIMYARCDYSCCCCCCYIIPYSLWFSPPIYIIYMYIYIYTVHITDLFIYIVTSWLLLTVRCVLMSILGFCRVAGPCLGQGCPVLQISISLSRLQWLQPPCLLINHSTCGSAVLSVVYSYTQE